MGIVPTIYLYITQAWLYRNPPIGCNNIFFEAHRIGSKASCEVSINRKNCYVLYLSYNASNEHQIVARKKHFSFFSDEKNLLELHVKIFKEGSIVFNDNITPPPASIANKSILFSDDIKPGLYKIEIKSLVDVASYADVPMSIDFKFCNKN